MWNCERVTDTVQVSGIAGHAGPAGIPRERLPAVFAVCDFSNHYTCITEMGPAGKLSIISLLSAQELNRFYLFGESSPIYICQLDCRKA